jgi:hypothetical protein
MWLRISQLVSIITWNPFSSAMYVTVYVWPSSPTNENDPRIAIDSFSDPKLLTTADSSRFCPSDCS